MSIQKAYLMSETKTKIPFMFNPKDLEFSKSTDWKSNNSPGSNAPQLTFDSGKSVEFKLTAIFDSTETGKSITDITDKLYKLTVTDKKVKGTKEDRNIKRPPWVQFHWGKLRSFKAVITSFNLKYTYFTSKGVPLRAEVSMSFRQFMDEGVTPPQNPTSGTPNPGQVRRLEAGQYLDTVADELYGDPGQWRAIANANGIDDPLALDPGRVLMIPELEG
jgi:hypothetical protein